MTFTQAITPNPNIPCKPGWCLQYVRQTFGLPAIHPTATAAWYAGTQHRDRNFPPGLWIPVWYALANEPAGHVVLRAPDGSVYSTSSLANTPYHHPNLAHLEAYYARYGMTLTYRGWTEDVQGIPVITRSGLAAQGTITEVQEDDMAQVSQEDWNAVKAVLHSLDQNVVTDKKLATALGDVPRQVWSYQNPEFGGGDAYQILRDALASTSNLAADVARVAAQSASGGASEEQITDAVKDAITKLLLAGAGK